MTTSGASLESKAAAIDSEIPPGTFGVPGEARECMKAPGFVVAVAGSGLAPDQTQRWKEHISEEWRIHAMGSCFTAGVWEAMEPCSAESSFYLKGTRGVASSLSGEDVCTSNLTGTVSPLTLGSLCQEEDKAINIARPCAEERSKSFTLPGPCDGKDVFIHLHVRRTVDDQGELVW